MAENDPRLLRTSQLKRVADEWALVLVSQGLSPTLRGSAGNWQLVVPADQAEHAAAILDDHDREAWARREGKAVSFSDRGGTWTSGFLVGALVLASFLVTDADRATLFARGAAHGERLLSGEYWRAVTSLTLHADAAHALANAVAAALFVPGVFRVFGPGLGSALVLLAGAGGNLLNAFLQGAGHASVGASTAVFGAVGLLGGSGLARRQLGGGRGRRAWAPFAAGVGLLAMLGTGGERTDFWAHGFGFAVGAALGLLSSRRLHDPPGRVLQWICGATALAVLLGSWALT